MHRLPCWLIWTLCCLATLVWTLPASAQGSTNPQATLAKATELLQKGEQQVADTPEAALDSVKEARLLLKSLKQDLAAKLAATQLTEAQLEQEDLNNRLAEDLFKKGELFHKNAKEKLARSKELADQGDNQAAQNLEGVAQIENRLALQNYVRSEIYSLRNQQMVFQTILKQTK
jgi:hypothetical protein